MEVDQSYGAYHKRQEEMKIICIVTSTIWPKFNYSCDIITGGELDHFVLYFPIYVSKMNLIIGIVETCIISPKDQRRTN